MRPLIKIDDQEVGVMTGLTIQHEIPDSYYEGLQLPPQTIFSVEIEGEIDITAIARLFSPRKATIYFNSEEAMQVFRVLGSGAVIRFNGAKWRVWRRDWKHQRVYLHELVSTPSRN